MPDYDKMALNGATCLTENKVVYAERRTARMARNRLGNGLSVYVCQTNKLMIKHYHIGHHGDKTRDEHRELDN